MSLSAPTPSVPPVLPPAAASPTLSPGGRRVLLGNLVAQVGIVVTGGLVRLTGSGLGCPTWPQCVPGSYIPVAHQAQGYHKDIEFANRLLISVLMVAAVGTLVVVWRAARRLGLRLGTVVLSAVPLVGVVAQAALGGVTVLTGLSPETVAAHFLLSMVLVAASTVLLLHFAPGPAPAPGAVTGAREVRWLAIAVAVLATLVLVLGTVVTGSGPHSGDATAPARFGVDPRAASWLHADAVWLFTGLVVALTLALRLTNAPGWQRRRAVLLLATTVGQGTVGYLQYATGLPGALVTLHLLGASLLVVATTATVTGILSPPEAIS